MATLLELSDSTNTHWSISEELNKFFRKEPKFKEAEIVQEGLIKDTFTTYYTYSESWVVNLGGKLYNVIINEGDWYNRRNKAGVKFQRYYPDGKRRTRRVKPDWEFEYKKPWELVVRNNGEGKRGDCQIWTVAVCLGITYKESFDLLYARGWREGNSRNEFLNDWKGIFAANGKTFEEYWCKWRSNCKKELFVGSTVGGIVKKLPSKGTFAVSTKSHIFSVIDGVLIDSCFEANNRVTNVYKIN